MELDSQEARNSLDELMPLILRSMRRSVRGSLSTREMEEALFRIGQVASDRMVSALAISGDLETELEDIRVADVLRVLAGSLVRLDIPGVQDLEWSAPPLVEVHTDGALLRRILALLIRFASASMTKEAPLRLLFSAPEGRPTFRLEGPRWDPAQPPRLPSGHLELDTLHFLASTALQAELREEPSTGSFFLTLPRESLVTSAFPIDASASPVDGGLSIAHDRATVLVVDDSRSTRNMLESILSQEHRVLTAESGPEAVAVALDQVPDLVLLDLLMEGMDGFAVCARLKSDPRTEEIPVIFLTSSTSEANEVLALEAGAIDFITKPVSPAAVAARVRNHLDLKRTHDRLREISLLDGLTGIANRRRFDRHLLNEWTRNLRRQTPIALILADVDHFKAYNDGYGHAQGDDCLRQVAQAFRQAARRQGDLAARYGGEEFAVILPETDTRGALVVAERMRNLVRAMSLPHAHSPTHPSVTISLGVASLVPDRAHRPSQLVEAADTCLYEAKHQGRDRVQG